VHLARIGARVLVLEQHERLGGKAGELRLGAYRFDTGPSVLTLPAVLEELFAFIGMARQQLLELVPLEPICRYLFPDGSQLEVSANPERMRQQLVSWSPESAHAWERMLEYSRRLYARAAPVFLFLPIHEPTILLRHWLFWRSLPALGRLDAFRSMHRRAQQLLADPRLVQIADRYATYNGSDPFRAPATLHLIFWVENGLGAYYIRGGIYRLVEALRQAAQELGVELRLGCRAERLRYEQGRVLGVETSEGFLPADAVVSNADVTTTYEQLLGMPFRPRGEPSLSGLVFCWGMRSRTELGHHTILFSSDYEAEFRALFQQGRPPQEPTVYIAITARSDPDHAPPDGENWFVLLNMPPEAELWSRDRQVDRIRSGLLEQLLRRVPGFDPARIEEEAVITPLDFQRRFGSLSLYGTASNSPWAAFRRPPNRSRRLRGLYFAGGSVHPGGGIPLVLLSGRHAARLLARDFGLPWQKSPTNGNRP
jgi:phytoene desaturase